MKAVSSLSASMCGVFTTINALSFWNLDHARMTAPTLCFSMLQQMGNGLGGAIMLRLSAPMHLAEPRGAPRRTSTSLFWAIGLLDGVWHFRSLPQEAGAALRTRPSEGKA